MLNEFIPVYEGKKDTLIVAERVKNEEEAIKMIQKLKTQFPRHGFSMHENNGIYSIKGELIKPNTSNKPPLGLKPKYIHDAERLSEIKEAINRHIDHGKEIPIEWIEELNELMKQNNPGDEIMPYIDGEEIRRYRKE